MKLIAALLAVALVSTLGFSQAAPVLSQTAPAAAPAAPAVPHPPEPATLEDAQKVITQQWNRLQDWAQLKRYHDADTTLSPPAKSENRVVFLGDSITDGWKLADYFPGKPYVNRGISGQTTPQLLIRFRPDVVDLQPKVVVLLAGTNDIAGNTGSMTIEQIEDNYASMAELAKQHGIRFVFASVLPVHDKGARGPMTPRRSPGQIKELNTWLQKYCADNKLVYLDYYSHMLGDDGMLRTELAADGLHPNADGYKIMAPLAEQAIDQALKKK
jgi:lysophospholipase L1-like esterase